jgi:hypothetical protein
VNVSRGAVAVFTQAAPTYGTVGPPHFTYFARRVVEFAGVVPGDRVLDVATGRAPSCWLWPTSTANETS